MKLSLYLSAGATFLLAAADPDEPVRTSKSYSHAIEYLRCNQSLAEAMRSLEPSDGITWLADDGVLRSFNAARDTVVDYAQLNERQIAEYIERYDKNRTGMSGV